MSLTFESSLGVDPHIVQRVARGRINVLVMGETGVGKEAVTRQLHAASGRARKPFLRINCAAFTETLIESELFGHERGAFTGASVAKPGLLEAADGGTVFLDEIGELPQAVQAKFLRVLEEQEIIRVGSTQSRKVDIRFISATNRDLEAEVEKGTFRRDLFFRIAAVTLRVPPLRERRSEITTLARRFIVDAVAEGQTVPQLAPAAIHWLEGRSWPGNIRELRNTIERAMLLSEGSVIDVEHLSPTSPMANDATSGLDPVDERHRIVMALTRCGGNQSRAARELGMARNTLIARIALYGLTRPRKHF